MKSKNFFGKIKKTELNIGNFIEGKGFYIIILLCIFVIGATAVVVSIRDYNKINGGLNVSSRLFNNNNSKTASDKVPKINEDERMPADTVTKSVAKPIAPQPVDKIEITPKNEGSIKDSRENITEKTAAAANTVKSSSVIDSIKQQNKDTIKIKDEEPLSLRYPVYGKISTEFAKDELIFSKTLNEWTTHNGVDISCALESPVKAAADGVIKNIENDPGLGITITIEHENGVLTVYSNLSTIAMVNAGEKVKRGQTISGVGNTAAFESEESPHIHFAVIKNGVYINPEEYLKK